MRKDEGEKRREEKKKEEKRRKKKKKEKRRKMKPFGDRTAETREAPNTRAIIPTCTRINIESHQNLSWGEKRLDNKIKEILDEFFEINEKKKKKTWAFVHTKNDLHMPQRIISNNGDSVLRSNNLNLLIGHIPFHSLKNPPNLIVRLLIRKTIQKQIHIRTLVFSIARHFLPGIQTTKNSTSRNEDIRPIQTLQGTAGKLVPVLLEPRLIINHRITREPGVVLREQRGDLGFIGGELLVGEGTFVVVDVDEVDMGIINASPRRRRIRIGRKRRGRSLRSKLFPKLVLFFLHGLKGRRERKGRRSHLSRDVAKMCVGGGRKKKKKGGEGKRHPHNKKTQRKSN